MWFRSFSILSRAETDSNTFDEYRSGRKKSKKSFKGCYGASYVIHCCCIIVLAIYFLLSLYRHQSIAEQTEKKTEGKAKERSWQRTIINADDFRNPYDYHVWVLIIIYITSRLAFERSSYSVVSWWEGGGGERSIARSFGNPRSFAAHCVQKLIQIKHKFMHYIKAIFHFFVAGGIHALRIAIFCHFSLQ